MLSLATLHHGDRIAVMQADKIVEMGSTEAISNQPQHPYTQELLGAASLLATMPSA